MKWIRVRRQGSAFSGEVSGCTFHLQVLRACDSFSDWTTFLIDGIFSTVCLCWSQELRLSPDCSTRWSTKTWIYCNQHDELQCNMTIGFLLSLLLMLCWGASKLRTTQARGKRWFAFQKLPGDSGSQSDSNQESQLLAPVEWLDFRFKPFSKFMFSDVQMFPSWAKLLDVRLP